MGLPIQPCVNILNRRLRWVIFSTSSVQVGHGYCRGCTVSCLQVSEGVPSLPSGCISNECISLGSGSIFGSQKVTLLSNWCLLEVLRHLSKGWLCGQLLLWLWEQGFSASPTHWLSLSMSLSSTWAALSACWWVFLASQRASSCGFSLLLGLDLGSVATSDASSSDVVG